MGITLNPFYDELFSSGSPDWDSFQRLADPTPSDQADLVVIEPPPPSSDRLMGSIQKIYMYVLSLFQSQLFKLIYPAQTLSKRVLSQYRKEIADWATRQPNLLFRQAYFVKNGRKFSAFMIGKRDTIFDKTRWVCHANGNYASIEKEVLFESKDEKNRKGYLDLYLQEGYNVLLINGPGVGLSDPMQSLDDLRVSQELAFIFFEQMKILHPIFVGVSLGAAMQSEAIQRYTFSDTFKPAAVIRLMTFDRLSHLIQVRLGRLGSWLFSFLGSDMESVAASKKLRGLNVSEYIFDNESDPLMKGASLGAAIELLNLQGKSITYLNFSGHYGVLTEEVKGVLAILSEQREKKSA